MLSVPLTTPRNILPGELFWGGAGNAERNVDSGYTQVSWDDNVIGGYLNRWITHERQSFAWTSFGYICIIPFITSTFVDW